MLCYNNRIVKLKKLLTGLKYIKKMKIFRHVLLIFENKMKIEKEKFIIILTVLIDVIGMGVIIPVLPFYVESFGASPFIVTTLFAAFAMFSFISGPFLGALSDRIGRRPVLIFSIASTAIGWYVFASAHSLWILFLGRIIDGAAAGNFPIAQSYLVDISKSDEERSHNLGLIGAMWGVGFIVGPALGATLSAISLTLPFWFVAILATINTIGAYYFLPETHRERNLEKKISVNPFLPIKNALKDKILLPRYVAWLLFGTAFGIMHTILALYIKDVFGYSAAVVGYVFTAMGILIVFNQMFLLKRFWLEKFSEAKLEIWFFLVMSAGFIIADFKTFAFFAFGLFIITVAQSVLRVVIPSAVVGAAGQKRRGEMMGIMASIISLSMIIGPILAGILFEKNPQYPFVFNVLILIVAFLLLKFDNRRQQAFVPAKL